MPDATPVSPDAALSHWQRRGLIGLAVLALLFGCLVEYRSAFLKRRMTDLDVYLRAAWAVRSGHDLYQIEDDNHWHYHYPPLFAILMTPLADAPAGQDRTGMLPFAASATIWYIFNWLCLALGIHLLASALEQRSSRPEVRGVQVGGRRWWALRVIPFLACLSAIGGSLMRGQVDVLLLLLVCGMAAAALHKRSWQAGFWLAGAICLKIIPAFLLLYPLWRRDRRWLAGCAVGLVLGLGLIPGAVFGPTRTVEYYQEWGNAVVRPALAEGEDQSRAKELLNVTSTDSQSFLATIHNTMHLDRNTRPAQASAGVRQAHWAISGLLTLVTLLAARRRLVQDGAAAVLCLGALVILMLLSSPVCHIHYFTLSLPLVMALMVASWEKQRPAAAGIRLGIGLKLLLAAHVVVTVLPRIPGLEVLRDIGLAMYAALVLWTVACAVVWRRTRSQPVGLAAGDLNPARQAA